MNLRVVAAALWVLTAVLVARRGLVTTRVSGELRFYRLGRIVLGLGLLANAVTLTAAPSTEGLVLIGPGLIGIGFSLCVRGGRRTDPSGANVH